MNQIQKILDSPIEKEQQANIKSRIRNNKKIVYSNKRLSKEIKNINTPDPRIQNQFLQLQIQSQKIQPIPIIKNSLPQKPNLIISQKSYTSNRFPTTIANKNNMWLNKYFIYRHDSLNRYITIKEFKASLEKLPENYNKLIYQYNRFRKQIINKQINDTNNLSQNKGIENKNINSNLTNTINNQKKKNFIVTGGYADVVKNLTDRGWVKENNIKSLEFDYIWTLKTNEINFMLLKNNQLCNHYFRNGQITRKSGLSKNIKNLYYKGIDPMNFFPRCYDLSVKTELEDFKQDFKFTWAISLLKLFQKESKEKKNNQIASYRLSSKVISTAINIIERNLFLIENKGQFLKNIDDLIKNNSKIFLVSDEEWNIIYLQELTQNSNVQDIIYEVNSNKPGGVNNPIKGANKTVPKKIIHKPNETKNTLINMNKAQIGVNDNQKFIPNLQSISSLKSKISPINDEEKKNNLNINKNLEKKINTNKIINSNNLIKKENKTNIRIKDGAPFNEFLPKISGILSNLEKNLPQYKLNGFQNIWIMKPSNLSRGRGVTCVDSLLPIEQSLSATNDSGLIVQKYIENPLIIKKRKFDIRQWVLVTSLNPLVIWMWKEPYLRFGAEDYIMDDLNNIYSHLTNNSIAKHSTKFKNEKTFEGDMWTCFDFADFIGKEKWKEIHEKIKNAIICSFFAVHQEIKQRENSHELYGYDFMIDDEYNVYLIEVNASPALDYSTKITEKAVKEMVKDLIELVIDYNNARDFKVDKFGEGSPNKFIQIFNEAKKDKIEIPKNVPNKQLFY